MTDKDVAERARRLKKAAVAIGPWLGKRPAKTRKKALKARVPTEHQEQAAVIDWWDKIYAPAHKLDPRLLFAIPNGANKSFAQAAKFKREGLRAGCPDLILAMPKDMLALRGPEWTRLFNGLFIEMKRIGGKASPAQIEFATILRNQGYNVIIAQGASEAIRAISAYLES